MDASQIPHPEFVGEEVEERRNIFTQLDGLKLLCTAAVAKPLWAILWLADLRQLRNFVNERSALIQLCLSSLNDPKALHLWTPAYITGMTLPPITSIGFVEQIAVRMPELLAFR